MPRSGRQAQLPGPSLQQRGDQRKSQPLLDRRADRQQGMAWPTGQVEPPLLCRLDHQLFMRELTFSATDAQFVIA